VLRTVCAQISIWQTQGFSPVPVAVNLSAQISLPGIKGLRPCPIGMMASGAAADRDSSRNCSTANCWLPEVTEVSTRSVESETWLFVLSFTMHQRGFNLTTVRLNNSCFPVRKGWVFGAFLKMLMWACRDNLVKVLGRLLLVAVDGIIEPLNRPPLFHVRESGIVHLDHNNWSPYPIRTPCQLAIYS